MSEETNVQESVAEEVSQDALDNFVSLKKAIPLKVRSSKSKITKLM